MTEIRRQQELRGEMSAEMALGLRNSLTTIAGYAQQLAASQDQELARQLAADIAAEAAHLDRTIGGFLAGAKLRVPVRKLELTASTPPRFGSRRRDGKRRSKLMKRMGYVFLAEVVLMGVLASLAGAQSEPLGDYARSVRKEEKARRRRKNTTTTICPSSDNISIVGKCHGHTGRGRRQPGA